MPTHADLFAAYFADQKKAVSESARANRFSILLGALFADRPDLIADYVGGIEKWVSDTKTGGVLRGRADALFGNLIVEFERDLNDAAKLTEAREQLRRYAAIQWNNEKPGARTPYLGLASDGVRFLLFTPIAPPDHTDLTPGDVELRALETVDLDKVTPDSAYFFLDRTFLRREVLTPTGARINEDFGLASHAFQSARYALEELWGEVGAKPAFAVVHETWNRYLAVVYGSAIGNPDLFLRHTYLATLAKMMAFMRLKGDKTPPTNDQLRDLIAGDYFKKLNLHNFLEEDFFSWPARPEALPTALAVTRRLLSLLASYDLGQLSEDVLKGLYQELVDPQERHELGEFYTPDWLAHKLVRQMLDDNPHASVFDPTCGSGTFLYFTIQEKLERLGKSAETTQHVLENVCGADVHPLAVIVAKTNVVLALGNSLVKYRPKGTLAIPVFLADTLKLPERFFSGDTYTVPLEKKNFYIHQTLLGEMGLADRSVELQAEFARAHKGKKIERAQWDGFLGMRGFGVPDGAGEDLWNGMNLFKDLLEADRDSIWAYVVKNIYKPLFFRHRFDLVLGNPPWIVLRSLELGYQTFVKAQTSIYGLAPSGARGHLVTQMEMASLFMLRAADLYLKPGGKIGFVLPRALFSADQHDRLRRGQYMMPHSNTTLAVRELWDLEGVKPLFRIPSCVVIGEKIALDDKPKSGAAIGGFIIGGKLTEKNAPLVQAEAKLKQESVEWNLHVKGTRSYWDVGEVGAATAASPYKKSFENGATIYPRPFWFVEVENSPLGFDPDLPPLITEARVHKDSKHPYRDIKMRGSVEQQFLYSTLLSADLLPFGQLDFRLIVLPIIPDQANYKMLTAETALKRGAWHLANWLAEVESTWKVKRDSKAGGMTSIENLNYRNKITQQNSQVAYRVVYNASGTNLAAAVIENKPATMEVNGQELKSNGFITDNKMFYLETNDEAAARYITAMLNAPIIDLLVKPLQSRGSLGPRDIHNKVLDLPIPLYKANDKAHRELAELGQTCAAKTAEWVSLTPDAAKMSIGSARGKVRQYLATELAAIDAIVRKLLGAS